MTNDAPRTGRSRRVFIAVLVLVVGVVGAILWFARGDTTDSVSQESSPSPAMDASAAAPAPTLARTLTPTPTPTAATPLPRQTTITPRVEPSPVPPAAPTKSPAAAPANPGKPAPSRPTNGAEPLDPDQAQRDAITALTDYLKRSDQAYQRADGDVRDVQAVASGPALGEVQATAAELQSTEQRQIGTVVQRGLDVRDVNVAHNPPLVSLEVCLSADDVQIVDSSGEVVVARTDDNSRTTAHLYGVEFHNGAWLVSSHSFPTTAGC